MQLNDMFNIFTYGWFADRTNRQPEEVFIVSASLRLCTVLDPTKQEVRTWPAYHYANIKKGQIEGFVLRFRTSLSTAPSRYMEARSA
jgi:hypothetical protein